MPDDHNTEGDGMTRFSGHADAFQIMAGWTPDGWEPPEEFPAFPLRNICPDAASRFAEAKHFTARDLKHIVEYLHLKDVDPRDAVAIYSAILDRVEDQPWALPVLELEVSYNRTNGKAQKKSKQWEKVGKVLSKLPLWKLRLENKPDLHKHTHEIAMPEVNPDLAIAAFCEYAIHAYRRKLDDTPSNEFNRLALSILVPEMKHKHLEKHLQSSAEIEDYHGYGEELLRLSQDYPDVHSPIYLEHITRTIRKVADMLGAEKDQDLFDLLGRLSVLGKKQSSHLANAQRDMILDQVKEAGATFDGEDVAAEAIEILRYLRDAGIMATLTGCDARIQGLETDVADKKRAIQEAQEVDDYNRIQELAQEADTITSEISEAAETRDRHLGVIQDVLDGKISIIDDLPEDLRIPAGRREDAGSDDATQDGHRPNPSDGADQSPEKGTEEPEETADPGPASVDEDVTANAKEKQAGPAADDVGSVLPEQVDEPTPPASTKPSKPAPVAPVTEPEDDTRTGASREMDDAEAELPSQDPEVAPVDESVLVGLIDQNILGIAADAAKIFEAKRIPWPIESLVLRAAACTRCMNYDYDDESQKLLSIAIAAEPDDLGSVMLLGSLLRPVTMGPFNLRNLRNTLPGLCRGNLGQHLNPVAEAISKLNHDFPPDPDELAEYSGTQREPLKQQLERQLAEWNRTSSRKTSKWHFVNIFMQHLVTDQGLIGAALTAVDKGKSDAAEIARRAIEGLASDSDIKARSIEFASAKKTRASLYPKGIEYLYRQFERPLDLLKRWVREVEREGARSRSQRSADRLRRDVSNLNTRLDTAGKMFKELADGNGKLLDRAVSGWIARQIEETISALKGEDAGEFSTLTDALTIERDLLPFAVREAIDEPDRCFEALRDAFARDGAPTPKTGFEQACVEGAFDAAERMVSRYDLSADRNIRQEMIAFAKSWQGKVRESERRLKTLAKVDYSHQVEILRWRTWCKDTLDRLNISGDGSDIFNLADIPIHAKELDKAAGEIEVGVRKTQIKRIKENRNDQNAADADKLLSNLDDLNIEVVEDRIAHLRDELSAASFEMELDGSVKDFTRDFLPHAASPDWPGSLEGFQMAMEGSGPLAAEKNRREASIQLIRAYRAATATMMALRPALDKVGALFQLLGFEDVKCRDPVRLGGNSHKATMKAQIRSDGWFLPPVFGSKGTGEYKLLMIGADTLPETAIKAIETGMPTIMLLSGVADQGRRRDFAERLRGGAHAALFIDEALIAFAATRRDTRAKTVFECGLPYGRIEPYTTDAGEIPIEMFFGREEEIRAIMKKSSDGCLVYGGRQLGKSALLNHISRTRNAPQEDCIVCRCEVKSLGNAEATSEIWGHLNSMLSPYGVVGEKSRDAESVSRDIKKWLNDRPRGQIVCMFDEADRFMDAETKAEYYELGRLKQLMEDTSRAFKVIFAGLHNVQRMQRQPNSPLAHLGAPICIGPFNRTEDDKRAAHDLVVLPMRAAGFRFETTEAVEEILAWANYYPSLVQEYAKGLLATMHGAGSGKAYKLQDDGPLWTIPTKSLFLHRGFNATETRIRQKFHWTLDLDPRYALIAYTLARLNSEGNEHQSLISGFDPRELRHEALSFWPKTYEQPTQEMFETLLEELFNLGVVGRVQDPRANRHTYLLRTRQVAAMLGSDDEIYDALEAIEEKDPTISYDPRIYRRRYAPPGRAQSQAEWPYSPLTDQQVDRILSNSPRQFQKNDAHQTQIVCGLDVLGLSKVAKALKCISEMKRFPGAQQEYLPVEIVSDTSRLAFAKATLGKEQESLVVFTPSEAKDATDAISWLDRQPQVIHGRVRPVMVLDAADDAMREIAVRRPRQSQFLVAWGSEMLRNHLDMIEQTVLDTPDLREAVLNATGGIPSETIRLVEEMSQADNPGNVARNWMINTDRFPEEIMKGRLGQALGLLFDLVKDGETCDGTLDELMHEKIGCDLLTIGPDLLATGLITDWYPKKRQIRYSSLGNLIRDRIQE